MKKQIYSLLVLLMFLIFCYYLRFKELNKYQVPVIIFFNTQEGDALMLRDSKFCTILIDGGVDFQLNDNLYKYLPFRKKNIDFVFLSHPHKDHYQGLLNLSLKYTFNNFFYPLIKENYKHHAISEISQRSNFSRAINSPVTQHACGFDINMYKVEKNPSEQDLNSHSMVLEVYYDQEFILFSAGDINTEQEVLLIKSLNSKSPLVFKSNHHGSKSSNSERFLNFLQPKITVITSGFGNRFNHPNLKPLRNIQKHSQKVLRTDVHGEIVIPVR